MLSNQTIWETAYRQSAIDCHCRAEDFVRTENVVVRSAVHPQARKYLPLPFACDLVSYGSNIVAQVNEQTEGVVTEYLNRFSAVHCFETPNLHVLADALRPMDLQICFMAEYFLPDVNAVRRQPCGYSLRLLRPDAFASLYREEWSNALCSARKELDVLAVGAYDGERLIGLAGCSADCAEMWQIGIDVLPEYRRQGIASALTSRLTLEILAAGKVPFYCAAWSNVPSVRNAIQCGFRPAWVELTARESAFVQKMNQPL